MTEPDNFIRRWARLKRESDIEHEIDTSQNDSAIEPRETGLVRPEATTAQPRINAAAGEPFDLSGLPSIEAITANTERYATAECRAEVSAKSVAQSKLFFSFLPIDSLSADYRDDVLEHFLARSP